MYRPQRTFLSPLDALNVQTRSTNKDGDLSGAPSFLPLPPSLSNSPPSISSPPQELWTVEALEKAFRAGRKQNTRYRSFSDQDIKTRNARALLSAPVVHKHRSAASYPIYSPVSPPSLHSRTSPFLPWGGRSQTMESSSLYSRPNSSASSLATRSSFESRTKSPLSLNSSASYGSSRTSQDSSFSNVVNSKPNNLLASRPQIVPTPSPSGKRMITEPIVPAFARYGPNGEDREAILKSLFTPQKLSRGPTSPTKMTFGKRKYTPPKPGEGFKKLPEEILLVILGELKKLHLHHRSLSCPTCWMRDVVNLGLSCRKWWSAARCILYEDIRLVGNDSVLHTKKKFRMKYGTRLKLLRRTLRARPDLAQYVKSLKVPAMPDVARSKNEQNEYLEFVASVIMACPNLERLPGFCPTYNHEFSRFVHALSTRQNLTERVWIINVSPFQRQRRYKLSEDTEYLTPVLAPASLLPEQCNDFLSYHSNWPRLRTLFLHCNPGGTIDSTLFTDIFYSLPSLENLHVSSFTATSFDDEALLSLPPLKKLRLENLPGVTAAGLSGFASTGRIESLKSLSLINLHLLSLPVLTRLFFNMKSLTRFTISQPPSPSLPIGVEIFLHPYLACPTLEYIHWEFTKPDDDQTTNILAKSIIHGGFPSLKTIRAPTDHEGTLQKLCRPRERIEMAADRYRNLGPPFALRGLPHSQSAPAIPSPTRSTFIMGYRPSGSLSSSFTKSPTRSTFSLSLDQSSQSEDHVSREPTMSLALARQMAQNRIDQAISKPRYQIVLWDAEGNFIERFSVGGYLGRIQSKIFYNLKPDVEGVDEAVVGVEGNGGLLDGGEEIGARDGCNGSWNLEAGGGKGGRKGKGKESWWHTDRGRWRDVGLEKFF